MSKSHTLTHSDTDSHRLWLS